MYMVDPGTLGRVCWARWAVVTAGRWPGVPGTGWHGTQATAETERPPARNAGVGAVGFFCAQTDAGAWCSGTACVVQSSV